MLENGPEAIVIGGWARLSAAEKGTTQVWNAKRDANRCSLSLTPGPLLLSGAVYLDYADLSIQRHSIEHQVYLFVLCSTRLPIGFCVQKKLAEYD